MKPPRLRFLPVSLALATLPFTGLIPVTQAHAAGPVTVAATTASESVYGFASRLPKDTEGFVGLYHLKDLWTGFKKSNFLKKILSNPEIVRELKITELVSEWENNPALQKYGTMAASLLGGEVIVSAPAGFTESVADLLKIVPSIQSAVLLSRASGPGSSRDAVPPEMLPVLEKAAALNVPPVLFAVKAGEYRADLKTLIAQALGGIPEEAMSKLDSVKFEVQGNQFEGLVVTLGKVMPEKDQAKMKAELLKATGSEEKASALAKKLLSKSFDLSWGWVDEYLVISVGSNHNHVKFVAASESVLTVPDVAVRAAGFAPKKPLTFSYTSQKTLKTLNELGGFFKSLVSLAEVLKTAKLPFKADGLVKELKTLEAKADVLWPNNPDAQVVASWWDGGYHAEYYGGNKPLAYDNSKPLTLGSFASDKTLLLAESRVNGAFRDQVFAFAEDIAQSVWRVYQKDVKPKMPDDARQGAAMAEMVGLPMVKELWKSLQAFRGALGNESAFFINLDGSIPEIPNAKIPPEVASKGKIPRIAFISELKDRAKLTESWNGVKTIISSLAAIAASQSKVNLPTEPVSKTSGDVEMFGYKFPIDTGDVWPHTAVSGSYWFFSTSPTFTKELAGRTATGSGPALGSHFKLNLKALWNFVADWAKLAPLDQEKEDQVAFALSLARCFGGVEVKTGEESGQSHDSFHIEIKDAE